MAEETQEAPKAKAAPAKKNKGLGLMGQISFCITAAVCFAISTYALIFFLFAMLPTFVTMTVDHRPGKYATSTVGAFNFMGIIPYFVEMIRTGNFSSSGQSFLTDIHTWFFVYGTASIGWIMIWSVPQIVSLFYHFKMQKRIVKIKESQNKLIEVWGENLRKY